MTNANTTKFILSETPEMTKKKLRGKLVGWARIQGFWSAWMWSGWSVGLYGLDILEEGSSELLGEVDPVGPAVVCALDWLGLVKEWAGLLAFIQLMWVTHPSHSHHCPLWDKISPLFHNLSNRMLELLT